MEHPTDIELWDFARDTGYQEYPLEIMLRLFGVLQAVDGDGFLRDRLAIKGGTALNAFLLDLDRLSMDIDLEYIGCVDDDGARADRNVIDENLSRILASQGYRIEGGSPGAPTRSGPGGSNWIAAFDSALGGVSKLRIDLGYVYRQPLFGVSRMPSAELGGRRVSGMLVLDMMDVFVGKLSALTQRAAARDLFDVMSLMDIRDDLDMDSLRAAFIAAVTASREGWEDRRIDMRGVDPYAEYQKLAQCMPLSRPLNQAEIAEWFDKGIVVCRERFGGLLALSPAERRFVDGVLRRGEINAGFLSAPSELRDRIAAWPKLGRKRLRVKEDGGMELG